MRSWSPRLHPGLYLSWLWNLNAALISSPIKWGESWGVRVGTLLAFSGSEQSLRGKKQFNYDYFAIYPVR